MNDQDKIQRNILPIPDHPRSGLITYDAKDPETKYPPIEPAASAQRCAKRFDHLD